MTTTMTDLRDGRTYVFNEALPGRDAYEDALAQGFEGTRAAWLASLRGFAFDPASADWEVDRPYAVNAAIRHQHKIWVAKLAHEGVTPGTDPEVWQLLLDGASALELSNAVAAALAHQGAAETAAGLAEAKRAAAAAILNATLDAAAALTPIDALHPVSLPIPAGWWDTGDRLLSGASERAIICNWAHEILAPAALWRGTVPASLRGTTDGAGTAAVGGTIARINDASGNGLHLTQASTSLRPIRGRRPKTGARNILVPWNSFLTWAETAASFASGVNARVVTENTVANPVDGTTNAAKIAASTTVNQQRLYTSSIGPRIGDRLTLSCHLKAAGINHVNLRTTSISGVNFNLATGVATNLSGPSAESWGMEDLGDGWYRCHVVLVTSSFEVIWLQLANGANTVGFAGNGTDGVFAYGYQVENNDHVTPFQQVNGTLSNITEMGVEPVSYAAFDMVDDVLTIGSIAGGLTGQAFVAGDGGCYVSDLSVAAGGTFSIGGTSHNWTGAAPGILRAVTGDTGRVLDVMIREGAYTEDEITRLERYYRAQGGKGLLVPDGAELVTNGTFGVDAAGWSVTGNATATVSSGQVTLSNDIPYPNGASAVLSQAVETETGGWYVMSLDIISRTPAGGFGVGSGSSSTLRDLLDAVNSTVGTRRGVFKALGALSYVKLFNGSVAEGAYSTFANVSVRRLIPREDL